MEEDQQLPIIPEEPAIPEEGLNKTKMKEDQQLPTIPEEPQEEEQNESGQMADDKQLPMIPEGKENETTDNKKPNAEKVETENSDIIRLSTPSGSINLSDLAKHKRESDEISFRLDAHSIVEEVSVKSLTAMSEVHEPTIGSDEPSRNFPFFISEASYAQFQLPVSAQGSVFQPSLSVQASLLQPPFFAQSYQAPLSEQSSSYQAPMSAQSSLYQAPMSEQSSLYQPPVSAESSLYSHLIHKPSFLPLMMESPSVNISFLDREKPRYDELTLHSFSFDMPDSLGGYHLDTVPNSPDMSIHSATDEEGIDRKMYYDLHALYTEQLQEVKKKNDYLQACLVNYYKGKKMFHVLMAEQTFLPEIQKRYEKVLDELDDVIESCTREQQSVENEIQGLRNKFKAKVEDVQNITESLEKLQMEYVKEMISAADENSKKNSEKLIEKYIRKQKIEMKELQKLRLAYIKLKNKYNEKQAALDSLDNLGPNLHLIDYEQLKSDNRNLADKDEERQMYLTTLKTGCDNTMQVLAHTREKLNAVDTDIITLKERLDNVTAECLDVREQVNHLKKERDYYRRQILKLKEQVGLLIKPHLLRDMERTLKELNEGTKVLDKYIHDFEAASDALVKLRKAGSTLFLQKNT